MSARGFECDALRAVSGGREFGSVERSTLLFALKRCERLDPIAEDTPRRKVSPVVSRIVGLQAWTTTTGRSVDRREVGSPYPQALASPVADRARVGIFIAAIADVGCPELAARAKRL